MIVKKGNDLPPNPNGALTLDPLYIGKHEDGWEIIGGIHEDYYEWINSFVAYKHEYPYGFVAGDFEDEVVASSEEVYQEFVKRYPPEAWDYGDI